MGFQKGNKQGKGRPAGAVNKTHKEVRILIVDFLDKNQEQFKEKMGKLNDRDFCSLYLKMLSMVKPNITPIYHGNLEPSKATDWELD